MKYFKCIMKYMFDSAIGFFTFIGIMYLIEGIIFDSLLLMPVVFDLFLLWIIFDICHLMLNFFSKN